MKCFLKVAKKNGSGDAVCGQTTSLRVPQYDKCAVTYRLFMSMDTDRKRRTQDESDKTISFTSSLALHKFTWGIIIILNCFRGVFLWTVVFTVL